MVPTISLERLPKKWGKRLIFVLNLKNAKSVSSASYKKAAQHLQKFLGQYLKVKSQLVYTHASLKSDILSAYDQIF